MDLYTIKIPPSKFPKPLDEMGEEKVVKEIIERCMIEDADRFVPLSVHFGTITPWMSIKLGSAAEDLATKSPDTAAFNLSLVSVIAAKESNSIQAIFSNLLTLGNFFLKSKDYKRAESLYLDIVNMPFFEVKYEKAGSHIGLASIYKINKNYQKEIYHSEMAIRLLRDRISKTDYCDYLMTILVLYHNLQDLAGIFHCYNQIKKPKNLKDIVKKEVLGMKNIDDVMALQTRLEVLGEKQLSFIVKRTWLENIRRGKSLK